MAIYNVHAGHNFYTPGANGFFSETEEDRIVKDKVINLLRTQGHTVYDCTDEDGKTQSKNLANIVAKCNQNDVDLDISIHFNAFNGNAHGVEVLQYSDKTVEVATRICENIAALGFTNRKVKDGSGLYVLRNTNSKAILIECCFCDNEADANLYDADKMAKAIVEGILNIKLSSSLYRVRKSWDDAKSQLGAYSNLDNAKNNCPVGYSVFDNEGKVVYTPVVEPEFISPLKGMDNEAFIEYIGSLAKADMKKTGVLASVTIAQAILESNWGQSELSLNANNLFGMKSSLSGNTWASEWEGKTYDKYSNEEVNGVTSPKLSTFRKYDFPVQSIKDHSDYLCGAMNGSKLRYDGLKGETDYKKAIQIIKDGGYATDSAYVDKVVSIIEKYNLDVFDFAISPSELEGIRDDIDFIIEAIPDILEKAESVSEFIEKFE